ncbi:MAG: methyltransferase [Candidatus Wallbacteria bacterium]|nr:methyltransferase [Candidatus Wallbacteria bacterium]
MRIDRLAGNMRIVQGREVFCLNEDSVLLANFPALRPGMSVLELGSGTGGVLLLVYLRRRGLKLTGVERDKLALKYLRKTIELNDLSGEISILGMDFRELPPEFNGKFDLVLANPPFQAESGAPAPAAENKRVSRVERFGSFGDFCMAAGKLMKNRGRFVFIHKTERLAQIMETLREHSLEPKQVRFIHPRAGLPAGRLLMESIKNGGAGLTVRPPLFVYQEKSVYTEEIAAYYPEGADA